MQFIYHENAGKEELVLKKDDFPHLFKVRRIKSQTSLTFRNMRDKNLYMYDLESLDKKDAKLHLKSQEEKEIMANKDLTIGWSIVYPKISSYVK